MATKIKFDSVWQTVMPLLYQDISFNQFEEHLVGALQKATDIEDVVFLIYSEPYLYELDTGREIDIGFLTKSTQQNLDLFLSGTGRSMLFTSPNNTHVFNEFIGNKKSSITCRLTLNREVFGIAVAMSEKAIGFDNLHQNFFEFLTYALGTFIHEHASERGFIDDRSLNSKDHSESFNPAVRADFFDDLRKLREVIDNLRREIAGINDPDRRNDDINSVRAYLDSFSAFLDDNQGEPPQKIPDEIPTGLSKKLKNVDWTTVSSHSQGWANTIISAIAKFFGGGV